MSDSAKDIKVWDPVVRFGHWILVAAFFTAYLTEDEFTALHSWAGYVVGTVIALRLVWGFVGSRYARFSNFVRSPATVLRYLRDFVSRRGQRHLGHNPAGAAMILALLLSVAGTVYTGLMVHAYENHAGPLATWVGAPTAEAPAVERRGSSVREEEPAEEFWEETHEWLANFTLLLVILHVTGGLLTSYMYRENLIKAMFTGKKRCAG